MDFLDCLSIDISVIKGQHPDGLVLNSPDTPDSLIVPVFSMLLWVRNHLQTCEENIFQISVIPGQRQKESNVQSHREEGIDQLGYLFSGPLALWA